MEGDLTLNVSVRNTRNMSIELQNY